MHREHDDAIADDDDEDDVGDDVGGFFLSPERRPACSRAKALELRKRQRQLVRGFCRKDAAEAATQQCHALSPPGQAPCPCLVIAQAPGIPVD